ncbi:MAG: Rdx family protein [Deltaproteobacteria bacterium]|nr:Rdx family protein [Deltaproteobacteria bacterium]
MADEIKGVLGGDAKLVPGGGGIFDVIADGDMIYSKFKTGRFPEHEEVIEKLKE